MGLVLSEAELVQTMAERKSQGERIVMTNGCFDLLHAGHVRYLQQARQYGDCLAVAVNSDESTSRLKGPERPLNCLADRLCVLAALASVDWVVSFPEDTPARLYCQLLPDVLVKGGDWEPEQVAGGDCVRANGGEVRVLDYWPGRSTSGMVERIRAAGGGAAEPSPARPTRR